MSQLDAGRTKLVHSLRGLREKWEQTEEFWKDRVRQEFEAEYLEELQERGRATILAMDRLAEIMERARRECGG